MQTQVWRRLRQPSSGPGLVIDVLGKWRAGFRPSSACSSARTTRAPARAAAAGGGEASRASADHQDVAVGVDVVVAVGIGGVRGVAEAGGVAQEVLV